MLVSEIFYSLQGEGVYTGIPMVFIRLQGCNLLAGPNGAGGCIYCDTRYARDGSKGTGMSVEEIVERCVELRPQTYKAWVCITGGEPLFQLEGLHELVKKLKNYGYRIEIETNGSVTKPFWWTLVDSWVADIKCPSSGVCGVSLIDDWFSMRIEDQVKFVVGNQEDLDFVRKVINSKVAYNPVVLVSPVAGVLVDKKAETVEEYWFHPWLEEVADFCKELSVRYSLQLHKLVWGNKTGV